MADKIQIEVLKGGVIKITTDPIGPENHASADELVKFIARRAGGETEVAKRTDAVHDHSEHAHDHEHI